MRGISRHITSSATRWGIRTAIVFFGLIGVARVGECYRDGVRERVEDVLLEEGAS